jgi:hypothetical protein
MGETTDKMTQEDTPAPVDQEYMMLCLPANDGIHDLYQLEFTHHPGPNANFLARLKHEYEKNRSDHFSRWGVERKLTGIRFVRFRTIYTDDPKPRLAIRVRVSHSLPRGEEDWVSGDPSDAAACTKVMLAGLNGDYELAYTPDKVSFYDLAPRKLQDPLPVESGMCGWGLHLVEEEFRKWWYKVVCFVRAVIVGYLAGIVATWLVDKILGLTINSLGHLALRIAVMWFVWRTIA